MLRKIEHIGIAVSDLQKSNKLFAALLGTEAYKQEEVSTEGVTVSFFKTGESKIELLQATNENSPIAKFIAKKGEGIHHIAVAVDDIEEALKRFKASGARLIDDVPRRGAHNSKIAFIHPSSTNGVLLELVEHAK